MKQERSYLIALGANIPSAAGDPAATVHRALAILHYEQNITIVAISKFWHTTAFPPGSGPDYVNAAAKIHSSADPNQLLAQLHAIEAQFGRERKGERWQSRPLDLDLIAANQSVMPDTNTQDHWREMPLEQQLQDTPDTLILPHPRLQERSFVLGPLAEIAPGWRHPRTGSSVAEMLAALPSTA